MAPPRGKFSKDRQQALEDVLWALLNSKEFMFNHNINLVRDFFFKEYAN